MTSASEEEELTGFTKTTDLFSCENPNIQLNFNRSVEEGQRSQDSIPLAYSDTEKNTC